MTFFIGRQLPDKAIDLVDEASACMRVQLDTQPQEIDKLDSKKTQLEIEVNALDKEDDKASQARLLIVTILTKNYLLSYSFFRTCLE